MPGGQLPTSPGVASDAPPSDQLPACAEYCLFRLHLRTNFQLFVGHLNLPAVPSDQPRLAPAVNLPVLLSNPISGLHRLSHPPASPSSPCPDSRRNSRPPALPSNPASDSSSGIASSDFTSQPTRRLSSAIDLPALPSVLTSGFHRCRIFGLSLRTQLPTCVGLCILRFCQRLTFVLEWSLNPPAVPLISCRLASTLNLQRCRRPTFQSPSKISSSGSGFRLAPDSRQLSTFQLLRRPTPDFLRVIS